MSIQSIEKHETTLFDCAIIGGGLAGLALSIQLVDKGHSVLLIEKNTYPFHKVCGEYISMESFDFIESLGLSLNKLDLPIINTLHVTAHNGYQIAAPLAMGGFGISRYTLDNKLATIAKQKGVVLLENCRATDVTHQLLSSSIETTLGNFQAKIICGSYGKITPSFFERKNRPLKTNYIGVKYHIKLDFPSNVIELHNFKDGYCGISKIDNESLCLCYLTTSEQLKENGNDIKQLEQNVLMQNPKLKHYFSMAEFLFDKPLTISNVTFQKKEVYTNGVFLLGDSAGTIAPLCGNGMSMALRASQLLANQLHLFFNKDILKAHLIKNYQSNWNAQFERRIKSGIFLQQFFGKKASTLLTLKILNSFPTLFKKIISLTHGAKF